MNTGNKLKSLPSELSACRDLELVRLASNQLESIPSWLFDLPKLSWIALSGNPMISKERASPSESAAEVPMTDFEVAETLGEGTSGVVKRAIWKSRGLEVALKIFKSVSTSDGNPLDEMRAALSVGRHPNTPVVHGAVRDGSQLGLILDLVPPVYTSLGNPPSFASVTRDTYNPDVRFSEEEIMRTLIGIASICAHLHECGLCHGDLYAHNILVDRTGSLPPLLCDFGAAFSYDREKGMNFEPFEVRAYGLLAEELSERVQQPSSGGYSGFDRQQLGRIISSCLVENPSKRPPFARIAADLSKMIELSTKDMVSPSNAIDSNSGTGMRLNTFHTLCGTAILAVCVGVILRLFAFSSDAGYRDSTDYNSNSKREL